VAALRDDSFVGSKWVELMKHRTASPGEAIPPPRDVQTSGDGSIDTATLELLASWRREDAMEDPVELHAAERELTEFKTAMNRTRSAEGGLPLYP